MSFRAHSNVIVVAAAAHRLRLLIPILPPPKALLVHLAAIVVAPASSFPSSVTSASKLLPARECLWRLTGARDPISSRQQLGVPGSGSLVPSYLSAPNSWLLALYPAPRNDAHLAGWR